MMILIFVVTLAIALLAQWRVKSATHTLDGKGGFSTSIEAEFPGSEGGAEGDGEATSDGTPNSGSDTARTNNAVLSQGQATSTAVTADAASASLPNGGQGFGD